MWQRWREGGAALATGRASPALVHAATDAGQSACVKELNQLQVMLLTWNHLGACFLSSCFRVLLDFLNHYFLWCCPGNGISALDSV